MTETGHSVSALYPTTASLYRASDGESRRWTQTAVPVDDLPADQPGGRHGSGYRTPTTRCDPPTRDVPAGVTVGSCRRSTGGRTPGDVARSDRAVVGVGRSARRSVAAAVVYNHRSSDRWMYDIEVPLVAGMRATIGPDGGACPRWARHHHGHRSPSTSHRLLARHVAEGSRAKVVHDWPWMLRLVEPARGDGEAWLAGTDVPSRWNSRSLGRDRATRRAGTDGGSCKWGTAKRRASPAAGGAITLSAGRSRQPLRGGMTPPLSPPTGVSPVPTTAPCRHCGPRSPRSDALLVLLKPWISPAGRRRRRDRIPRGTGGSRPCRGLQRRATSGTIGVPVINTWGAKGVFRWDSELHGGTAGLQARDFELARVGRRRRPPRLGSR